MSNALPMPLQPSKKKPGSSSQRSSPILHIRFTTILLLIFVATSTAAQVAAQETTNSTTTATAATIQLSFLDSSGTPLSGLQSQTIPKSTCTALNTPALTTTSNPENTPEDDNGTTIVSNYTVITVSDQHAALNLYTDTFCQVIVSATVGQWNTSSSPSVANIKAIRWEGDAPATLTPGTLIPTAFPPNLALQHLSPVEDDGTAKNSHHNPHHKQEFVLDPAKGRFIVGLVSVIMAVGILIGVSQVYKAAQYVPPARSRPGSILSNKGGYGYSYSNANGGGGGMIGTVGARKVKRKEAYYKKSTTSSSPTFSTGNFNHQHQQLQQQPSTGRSSMATLATLRATGSPGSSPAITIDMHEGSSTLLEHPNQGHSGSSSLSQSSSSHSHLHAQQQPPRLEVLVPIQSLENQAASHGEHQ